MPSKSTYIGNGERSPALYPVETFIRESYYKLLVDQVLDLCLSLSHPGQARVAGADACLSIAPLSADSKYSIRRCTLCRWLLYCTIVKT